MASGRVIKGTRLVADGILRSLVRNPVGLRLLNIAYNRLPLSSRPFVWAATAKMFRHAAGPSKARPWTLRVAGGRLTVPLKPQSMWLNWDHAVAITGHDLEVKERYFERIKARDVDHFVDVGANYGTHSLLFLVAGIRALSFEPNPACIEIFEEYCRANGVAPNALQFALGEQPGSARLHFPERDTWLGTLASNEFGPDAVTLDVEVRTLDEFIDRVAGRVLLKLDVEGHEVNVLRGARKFLSRHRPEILFESRKGESTRPELIDLLTSLDYGIFTLPSGKERLTRAAFIGASANNFSAIHWRGISFEPVAVRIGWSTGQSPDAAGMQGPVGIGGA